MKMMFCLVASMALVLSPVQRTARAGPVFGYGIDNSDNLYLINLKTAATTYIGNTGVFLEGLALSPTGQLYGSGLNGNLYSISKTTGASTLIGSTGYHDIEGLHFDGSTLLGAPASFYPEIISINPANAHSRLVLTSPQLSGGATAMTIENSNTALLETFQYGTYGTSYVNQLRSINLTTGVGTVLGTTESGTFVAGLDFGSDGRLYGLDTSGNVLLINPTNGLSTVIGNDGKIWLDLAAIPNAVPEPASLAMLGLGLVGLLGFARRRPRRSTALACVLGAIGLSTGSAQAGLIDVNFAGISDVVVTGAGVVGHAGDSWNGIHNSTTAASSGSNIALTDTSGRATGVLLSYTGAGAAGPEFGPTRSPNPNLTSSYADTHNAPGDVNNLITVNLAGLSAGVSYGLYVYDVADYHVGTTRPGQVSVLGGPSAGFNGNGNLSTWVAGSNYVELAAIASRTGSISFTISPTGGNHEIDFNGFQLLSRSVPEPGSLLMAGLGLVPVVAAGRFLRRRDPS